MKHALRLLLGCFVLSFAGSVDAQVLTFNDTLPRDFLILGSISCGESAGLRFSSDHFHLIDGDQTTMFSSNGTSYIGYESIRGVPITIERIGAGTFSLLSLDAGEFYSPALQDYPNATQVTLTGYQLGGATVTHTFNLDGIHDGPGGAADFEHVVLPSTFVDLTSAVITGLRSNGEGGGIAIDNIEYFTDGSEAPASCVATPLPTGPAITIVSPTPGTVAGSVVLEAAAGAGVTLSSVQFQVDGVNVGAPVTVAPFRLVWDSTVVADGPYAITAVGRDANNTLVTASVTITVRNEITGSDDQFYVDLDGLDDAATVVDTDVLSFGTGTADTPFTMEMWLRPDDLGRAQILGKWGEGGNQEYRLAIVYGTFLIELRDPSAGASVSAFTAATYTDWAGTWHHLAVTYDGRGGSTAAQGLTLYLDGVAVPVYRSTDPGYVAMENLAAALAVGHEGPGWHQFDGGLDELRLWGVARTASQIQGTLTTELTGTEPGLRAYWRFNEGTGLVVAGDAPADQPLTLLNGPLWVPGGPLAPDLQPPDIGEVATSAVTATSVTVSFTTSEAATALVRYTATGACPCVEVASSSATIHNVVLTGLVADTLYSFVIVAQDAVGNVSTSPIHDARTLAAATDVEPPAVTLTAPSPGSVGGLVTIAATATDNIGVVSVQFFIDGVPFGPAQTGAPYGATWDTTSVSAGAHTIAVQARDAVGLQTTVSVTITVQNTPVEAAPHYVDFDGVNDAGTVIDTDALSFGTGTTDTPLTIEMWIRPDDLGRAQLLGKWGEGSNQEFRFAIVYGTFLIELRDPSAGASASAFTAATYTDWAGTWHHLAVTYDGRGGSTAAQGLTLYLDGVAVPVYRSTDPGYVAMENLAAALAVGHEGPGWRQFDGGLDELRLWGVTRTASQIQATLATELTGTEPGLRAYWRFNEGTGLVVAGDAPADQPLTLLNGPLWIPGGPLAPDMQPPHISGVATSTLTASSVMVSFTTSEAATAWVRYTATGACPCVEVASSSTGTIHSVPLTGLTADTLYSFVVVAQDAAGNVHTSPAYSVQTLASTTDLEPPVVSLTAPGPGIISGVVSLAATATDNVGVVSVQFLLDGVAFGPAQTVTPYGAPWDTTTVADGAHVIAVQARDAAGLQTTASVTITVRNIPVDAAPHYLDLDGVDDAATAVDTDILSFGTGTADTPFTMEVWLRPDDLGRAQILGKWGEGSNQEYRLAIVYGTFWVELRDQSAGASALAYTAATYTELAGTWHHLAVTYDGRGGSTAAQGLTLYLDGVAVPVYRSTDLGYVAMENLAAPLAIGHEGPGWHQFDGGLDELRLWGVARTTSEIQATLTTELTGTEPGLRAYWRFNEGTGLVVAGDAPADQPLTLLNGPLWVPGGPLAPDDLPPTISGIATTGVTPLSATVSFTTSEAATALVRYTATGACPCIDVPSGSGTTHSVPLAGLTPDTLYSFVVVAQDAAGNVQTSAPFSVRTLVAPTDTQPPGVALTDPAPGLVSGTVTVAATATDNVGVVSVQFLVDGIALGPANTIAPYSAVWDTTTVTDGAHTVTAVARDAAGLQANTAVIVSVQNTPAEGAPHYVDFDGVNNAGTVIDTDVLSFGAGTADTPLTIEMWIRPDDLGRAQLVGKWGEGTHQEYRLAIVYGTFWVELRDQSAGASALAYTAATYTELAGTWHHLAVTYDGRGGSTAAQGLTLYLDGVAIPVYRSTDLGYVAMENLAAPLAIGHEGPGWHQFDGGLDELRLWGVARTTSEIQATLTTELTGTEPGLRAYWRFNEGTGLVVAGDAPADQPLTLLNGPLWVPGGPLAP